MKTRKFFAPVIATLVLLMPLHVVLAATVSVTPLNTNGWQPQASGTASVTFVNGPATPPLGVGSAQFSVGSDGNSGAQLRNPNYGGTLLTNITALSYSTYVSNDATAPTIGDQTPYIILNVDRDGNGTLDDLLFFEPEYQHGYTVAVPDQGDNVLNTWQTWDARNGGWYGIDPNTGAPTFAGAGADVQPLSNYITTNPGSKIINGGTGLGGLRLVAGFGAGAWDNFIGNVDNVTINVSGGSNTTFNFEPTVTNLVWTTTGSTGTVDEEDLSIVELNNFVVGLKGASTGTVNVRYNINAASVPAASTTGTQKVSVVVRFRDSDGAGTNERVFFTIRRSNIRTGGNEVLLTFDSNTQPPAGSAFQTQTVTDCSASFDFDSTQYVYWIEAEVTRNTPGQFANLGGVQIIESNDTCP